MKRVIAAAKQYIVALLALLTVSVWALVLGSLPVSSDRSPVRVMVGNGASAGEIAGVLADKGLIRSPFVFVFTCRMSGLAGQLRPGVYEFDRAMNLPMMIKQLVRGESMESWITVPEGFTARQIADVLEDRQLVTAEAFLRMALTGNQEFTQFSFLEGDNLEGYLFPDTYLITRGTDARGIVEKMLDAFEKKVARSHRGAIEQAIQKRFGLGPASFDEGLHKLLTVASLVEREAKIPKDRPLIAAALYNRLQKRMRLEVDATVSYVPGDSRGNKDRVYHSDLESGSPYNTYRQFGLPPGPICNPGLAAIKAAMDPAKVDYLYYVTKPDGSHVFTCTLQEHDHAKNAIRNGAK